MANVTPLKTKPAAFRSPPLRPLSKAVTSSAAPSYRDIRSKVPWCNSSPARCLLACPWAAHLAAADIARIENWIRSLPPAGNTAAKTEWRWPFEKPVKPPGNSIDGFLLAKLKENGLQMAPPASKRVLVRRVYFDLIGLPPTPEEAASFEADPSPDAYAKLIDKLLADPRYGERWGRHWLDLARYGETSGLEGDGAIGNVWRYRDWVINAFNTNMPYDRFVHPAARRRRRTQPDPQQLSARYARLCPDCVPPQSPRGIAPIWWRPTSARTT